jgi:hypothetical protein
LKCKYNKLEYYKLLKTTQAYKPAVSVRNRLFPKLTGIKLFCIAALISSGVKSPSGPIKIIVDKVNK